ncbi:MAG TPA: helicase-associated domain-containing protein [Anaerolineales bacterium]|nr:helicase-associated domain-containing protein [Anaerolineales bacterium]
MPVLEQILLNHDLTLLRAIASQAGVELAAPNTRAAAAELAAALKQPETLELLIDRIGQVSNLSHNALSTLLASGGRHPVAAFVRRFGDIRPLGPAALSRESPWEKPATATESLYYNGLIGRAFMESETGPQEYFVIPSDLISLIPPMETTTLLPPAQAIAPVETDSANAHIATSLLVDDAVTVLAALQLNPGKTLAPSDLNPHLHLPAFNFLSALLADLGFITPNQKLDPEKVKPFLQSARAEQLHALADAWRDSKTWNDLLRVPSLRSEPGAWQNDPAAARNFLLRLCADLPPGEWRSLDSFVAFVREHQPDFQRPAGDYDSWYIRDAESGDYLRGFEHWDRVDGALVRYLLTGPMHWLGLVDVRKEPDAFRLSFIFPAFAKNETLTIAETPQPITCKGNGTLLVSRNVNRYDRFQAARIGEWMLPEKTLRVSDNYEYRLTGNALQTAAAQGITAKHIVSFLRRVCEHTPQHIIDLIERWGANGIEARAASMTVLKLKDAELLEKLMRSPRTRRWLGEAIGDRAVEVKDWDKLSEAMAEIGLTAEFVERRHPGPRGEAEAGLHPHASAV